MSVTESTRPVSSLFWDAVLDYKRTRAALNKKPGLLDECINSAGGCSLDAVQSSIHKLEISNSNKTSTRIIRKILKPVIAVLNDYTGVLDVLSNADPMPTALIWGILKAAIECSNRYLSLYEKISTQLRTLTDHLHRLTIYEELFVNSVVMQEELKKSYINVLKFWSRVAKECKRSSYSSVGRAVTSFSTRKLDKILDDLREDADVISKLIPLVQQREHVEERKKNDDERRLAVIARTEISLYVLEERNSRLQHETERRRARQKDIRDWIQAENAVNVTHFQQECSRRHSQTCQWILKDTLFIDWLDWLRQSQGILWLRGPPGAGKSVMSAFVIETVRNCQPMACVAYQYYSSNEQYSALDAYRNIADQLLDQLWDDLHDIPDHIHAHVQHTRGDKARVLKLIELLLAELNGVYLFLDGLDETCGIDIYWREVRQVIAALCQLSSSNPGKVRLWISSQDRLPIRKSLQGCSNIDMTEQNTAMDISTFFNDSAFLEDLNIDEDRRSLIVQELNVCAKGNFLYAYLMADSLQHAENLRDLVSQIKENLPRKLDDYYHSILARIDQRQYPLYSKILTFVTFAKRPLRFTEPSEAIAMLSMPEDTNLSLEDLPAISRINQSCEPLIKVLGDVNDLQNSAVTLSHSTVRAFLIRHPHVFRNGQLSDKAILISEDEVASTLLRYLQQPRYCYPLVKGTVIWRVCLGEDVGNHYLLTYAAKYWDKHSDKVSPGNRSSEDVLRFVKSPQFGTCLQVQSLSVEGHFGVYLPQQVWVPPHLKRIFPRWFSESTEEGKMISRYYQKFVSEWGALFEYKCLGGIDHCLLGALGPWNFLSQLKCRYSSFIFAKGAKDEDKTWLSNEFAISADGSQLLRVMSESAEPLGAKSLDIDFILQTWSLQLSGPKLLYSQAIHIDCNTLLDFDDHQFRKRGDISLPALINASSDLRYLRIGSQIFHRGEKCVYISVVIAHRKEEYIEDLASHDRYLAVARRRSLMTEKQESSEIEGNVYAEFSEFIDSFFEGGLSGISENRGEQFGMNKGLSNSALLANNGSYSQPMEENLEWASFPPILSESTSSSDAEYPDAVSSATNASSEENSAYEWESMLPSSEISDESSEREEWNNSTSSESTSNFDISSTKSEDSSDSQDSHSAMSTEAIEGRAVLELGVPIDGNFFDESSDLRELYDDYRGHEVRNISDQRHYQGNDGTSDSECNTSLHSDQTEWSSQQSSNQDSEFEDDGGDEYSSDEEDSDDGDSDDSNQAGERLDNLMSARAKAERRKSEFDKEGIRIYDTSSEPPTQIFSYSQVRSDNLYNSPPIFHPTQPLLVWALGGGEVVFINYSSKTYFSRRLNRSSRRACYISIRFYFSSCGSFLHICALEARKNDVFKRHVAKLQDPPTQDMPLRLLMQVSTHRLSVRKTARCAPRLIFRKQVDLGTANSIPISKQPYTLTWTDEWLFITHNDPTQDSQMLKVFRVPLQSENEVEVLENEIYLPRSSTSRTVHYFPPSGSCNPEIAGGTVVLSSTHTHTPSYPVRGYTSKTQHSRPHNHSLPPIGFRFNLALHTRWTPQLTTPEKPSSSNARIVGGRLRRKFEQFDKQEDRDIIAYLS